MFARFVCALLSFCEHEFPENPKPENLWKLLWNSPRILVERGMHFISLLSLYSNRNRDKSSFVIVHEDVDIFSMRHNAQDLINRTAHPKRYPDTIYVSVVYQFPTQCTYIFYGFVCLIRFVQKIWKGKEKKGGSIGAVLGRNRQPSEKNISEASESPRVNTWLFDV